MLYNAQHVMSLLKLLNIWPNVCIWGGNPWLQPLAMYHRWNSICWYGHDTYRNV